MYLKPSLIPILLISLSPCPAATQRTPIDRSLLNTFKRYAAISAFAYPWGCPKAPEGINITHQVHNNLTDARGFIAQDVLNREVIVAFSGTTNSRVFKNTDLDQTLVPLETTGVLTCPECFVHEGYLRAWNSIAKDVAAAVQDIIEKSPGTTVTVTGHSLGGCLASIATVSLVGLGFNVTTYTFGQSRVGNKAYANYVDQQAPPGTLYRVTHFNDGVPQVPSTKDGYWHHSTEFWQDQPFGEQVLKCTGQEPKDCNNSLLGLGVGPGGRGINPAHGCYVGTWMGPCLSKS